MSATYVDVCCIGNAIVDVIAESTDAFLAEHKLTKGAMTLIDADQAEALYQRMPSARESSGGSAANTAAGLAAMGDSVSFIGKVRDDQLGSIFRHDIRAVGVGYATSMAADGPPTARCLIFVTPDAERTMQTFLGASTGLTADDIDPEAVGAASIVYLEGYLFDPPHAKEAFVRAAEVAHAQGRQVALTLSDPFCVERHRESFRHLVRNHIDLLFANEQEVRALYQVESFDDAMHAVRDHVKVAVLTRGAKGSVILGGGEVHVVDAVEPAQVVDTTGAGDLFAAGFLHGYVAGRSLAAAARVGSMAAAEVISQYGARPETDLKALAARLQ